MATPTQYAKESIKSAVNQIRPEIRNLTGYLAPPQEKVVAKLNQNENPYDLPLEWKNIILNEMKNLSWSRYPIYEPPDLRHKIAEQYGLDSDYILLGNGSNQLLFTVMMAIIGSEDTIVMSPPSFSLFELVASIFQTKIDRVLQNPDFTIPLEEILKKTSTAKMSLFCSPNNPTGKTMDLKKLEQILQTTSGLVLWDEAYGEFCSQKKSAIPLLMKYPNLLVMRTFSKAFGLAGLRIGYLITHPSLANEIRKINLPYNLNLFSTLAAHHILDNKDWVTNHVHMICDERQNLYERMLDIETVTPYPSEANFILFRVSDGPSTLKLLERQGVLVRNMNYYPMLENCLRVTIGTAAENHIFIEKLKEVVQSQ